MTTCNHCGATDGLSEEERAALAAANAWRAVTGATPLTSFDTFGSTKAGVLAFYRESRKPLEAKVREQARRIAELEAHPPLSLDATAAARIAELESSVNEWVLLAAQLAPAPFAPEGSVYTEAVMRRRLREKVAELEAQLAARGDTPKAGDSVSVKGMGKPFDGVNVVTSVSTDPPTPNTDAMLCGQPILMVPGWRAKEKASLDVVAAVERARKEWEAKRAKEVEVIRREFDRVAETVTNQKVEDLKAEVARLTGQLERAKTTTVEQALEVLKANGWEACARLPKLYQSPGEP